MRPHDDGTWSVVFTGTQKGMTKRQVAVVRDVLAATTRMQNGCCVGADAQAAVLAWEYGRIHIEAWPSTIEHKRAHIQAEIWHKPLPPLVRNKLMVSEAARYLNPLCLATPGEYAEQLRSGTWATVRYAKRIGMDTLIVYPDGTSTYAIGHPGSA